MSFPLKSKLIFTLYTSFGNIHTPYISNSCDFFFIIIIYLSKYYIDKKNKSP